MPMSVDQMRQQMQEVLGAAPIRDQDLAQYATLVAALSGVISTTAEALVPEDEAGAFAAYLDSFGDDQTDKGQSDAS